MDEQEKKHLEDSLDASFQWVRAQRSKGSLAKNIVVVVGKDVIEGLELESQGGQAESKD